MMGGFGSGRPAGSGKAIVESCRSLDANQLHREGCLSPGCYSGWDWKRDGETVASISMRGEENRIVLNYRYRLENGEWQSIEQPVSIVHVPCSYGGSRPYLICPGSVSGDVCNRRVIKLYGSGKYFLCRHCYRLAYASQREDQIDRTLRRANKIRQRLGGDPGMASAFPKRPKGMWRRTYRRLREQTFRAEFAADEALDLRAERLLSRFNQTRDQRGFWP